MFNVNWSLSVITLSQQGHSKIKKWIVCCIIVLLIIAAVVVYFVSIRYSRRTGYEITFGTTEILSQNYLQKNSANWKVATLAYLNHRIRLTKISVYVKAESGTARVRGAIYENDPTVVHPNSPDGTPSSLIVQTAEVTVDETPQIHDFGVMSEVIIDSGYYWLAMVSSEDVHTTFGDAGADNPYATMCYNANTYNGFTDPFGEGDYAISEDKTIYGTGIVV